MLKNYLKTATRNISRQKAYAIINAIGLAVGISCMALAFLYAQHEFSFDRFHKDADRIYRVCSGHSSAVTPAELAPAMMDAFPEVESATRLLFGSYDNNRVLFHYRDKSLYSSGYYGDEHFFDIFSYTFVSGDPRSALAEPNALVITEGFSRKYFGGDSPMGKIISFDKKHDLKVTGVIENIPANSHLQFDFLVSFATYAATPSGQSFSQCWACSGFLTYCKLRGDAAPASMERKLADLMEGKAGGPHDYVLQPVTDIRLFSGLSHEPGTLRVSDIYYVYLALSIALVILLLGCLNYVNIATSQAASRADDIGIRKIIGAGKRQLILQHILESLLISLLAAAVSLMLIELLLPFINTYAGLNIQVDYAHNPYFVFFILLLCAAVSLAAGGYPALVFSSINPLRIIHKQYGAAGDGLGLRRLFVVIQFGLAICLLAITLIIESQLHYVRDKDVGYNRQNVVILKLKGDGLENNRDNIKSEIRQHAGVIDAAYSSHLPCAIRSSASNRVGENGDSAERIVYYAEIDEDFADVYDLEFVGGRNFSTELHDTRQSSVIVNAAAGRLMGWDNPVGQRYAMFGDMDAEVVGVVKDFNFLSLHQSIAPLVLVPGDGSYLSVRIRGDNRDATLRYIEEVVGRFIPDYPFEYKMLDDYYHRQYAAENNLNIAFSVFAGIAIFVACLGLVGLSSFSAAQKAKEIAIRKVLGASVADIVSMLTKEFILLVAAANAIAWPIAYYAMSRWLEHFVYRIDMDISTFFVAGFAAVLIAVLTVSYHALKAALADPIKGIRRE